SREIAIEKALERCQHYYDEPCATIAADDGLVAPGPDGAWKTFDMPRARYRGTFDPAQIPGVRSSEMTRPEVVGYAGTTGPKAAAYHVRGVVKIVTGAASQRRAEEQVLRICNSDPRSRRADGNCYLYAVGNDVVLTQRLTAPLTAR